MNDNQRVRIVTVSCQSYMEQWSMKKLANIRTKSDPIDTPSFRLRKQSLKHIYMYIYTHTHLGYYVRCDCWFSGPCSKIPVDSLTFLSVLSSSIKFPRGNTKILQTSFSRSVIVRHSTSLEPRLVRGTY